MELRKPGTIIILGRFEKQDTNYTSGDKSFRPSSPADSHIIYIATFAIATDGYSGYWILGT
jgi:hypothetical protein